jgi:hypothetical protein
MDDDGIRTLLDERAIERLMVRYADRIDADDPVGAAACFAPDGLGVYWGDYRGRAAIAERLDGILARFTATSHHLTNMAATIDGDRATAQSYVYAFHRLAGSGDFLHVWARWVDELARIDGEWLFTRREVVGVGSFAEGDVDRDRFHPGHPGRRNRSVLQDRPEGAGFEGQHGSEQP